LATARKTEKVVKDGKRIRKASAAAKLAIKRAAEKKAKRKAEKAADKYANKAAKKLNKTAKRNEKAAKKYKKPVTKETAKKPKKSLKNTKRANKTSNKSVEKNLKSNSGVGVVQSRINFAEKPTRFTRSKNAGMEHIRKRHYNPEKNAGQFTISEGELKGILQTKSVIKVPVKKIPGGDYERIVNVKKVVGKVKPSLGRQKTTWLEIITDRAGNIVSTYPIPKP